MTAQAISSGVGRAILIISFVLAFAHAVLLPPINGPDEDSHFKRIQTLMRGDLLGRAPKLEPSLIAFIDKYAVIRGDRAKTVQYSDLLLESYSRKTKAPLQDSSFSAQTASPFVYLPQLMGSVVAHIASRVGLSVNSWYNQLLFSRLGNVFVFYLCVFYLGCRYSLGPFSTLMLLVPMLIAQIGSVSYDGSLFLAVIAFVTILNQVRRTQQLSKFDIALFLIASFVLTQSKFVYVPILGLALLVFTGNLIRGKQLIILTCTVGVLGTVAALLLFPPPIPPANQALVSAQLNYLLNNWSAVPGILFATFKAKGSFYISSFVFNLGSLDTPFYPVGATIFVGALLWTVAKCAQAVGIDPPAALLTSAVGAASCILIFFGAYVTWTPFQAGGGVGALLVDGVQGRYFLPLLPLLDLIFRRPPPLIVGGLVAVLPIACLVPVVMLLRYYL